MPAQIRIILTGEEERTLRELRQAQTVPQRVRERAHILQLNRLSCRRDEWNEGSWRSP